jgi:hypothetical protein
MKRFIIVGLLLALLGASAPAGGQSTDYALRFYGWGFNDEGRVKIPLTPNQSVNLGDTDFTIEFWMKATRADNPSGTCTPGGDNWINGNILLDRDIFGSGDIGDYGLSIYGGKIAFGVHNGTSGETLCSSASVTDGTWKHIAITRRQGDGLLRLFINGALDTEVTGPAGDIRYRDGRATNYPNSDPFLVLGAEKHDVDPAIYPPYDGLLDELRLSSVLRYSSSFTRPTAPFTSDADTLALYHFDEGSGSVIEDAAGSNDGERRFGGTPAGPVWVTDTPFASSPTATPIRNRFSTATPELTWQGVTVAVGYQLEVDESSSFTSPLRYDLGAVLSYLLPAPLTNGRYYWRVRAALGGGRYSGWSAVESFVVEA